MTTLTSESFAATAANSGQRGPLAGFRSFLRQFFMRAFDPYRPELHYMRGPGPAWHAKHKAVSPAVQLMLVEIRAAKALRSSAR